MLTFLSAGSRGVASLKGLGGASFLPSLPSSNAPSLLLSLLSSTFPPIHHLPLPNDFLVPQRRELAADSSVLPRYPPRARSSSVLFCSLLLLAEPNADLVSRFNSFTLSDYKYLSYNEVFSRIEEIASGLRHLGIQEGSRVGIYADTS